MSSSVWTGYLRAEGDDAADRVVGRHADGDAITGNDFDAEAPHPAAQLREHFMSGIALHAIQAARVDGHHRSLHVDQIVFAQSAHPFESLVRGVPGPSNECATVRVHASKSIISNS